MLEDGPVVCFATWGDVPREFLIDQMPIVFTRADRLARGGHVTNLKLARFARGCAARVDVCLPYRAQTEGHVERPSRCPYESFLRPHVRGRC